jgi:hypothetical protein
MKGLIKYLFHRPTWQKLPVLPRMYSTEYDARVVDKDTSTLMMLTHTRCPQGVEVLKRRHHLKTSRELIEQLPARRRRRRPGARLMALFRRWLGTTPYDPMRSIAQQHRRVITWDGRR